MAALIFDGTIGDDSYYLIPATQTGADISLLAGDEYLEIKANFFDSLINGNEGDDEIVIDSVGAAGYITDSTIRGGKGNDQLYINTQVADGDQFWGDEGNDLIVLSSLNADAEYTNIVVEADSTSFAGDGTDVVYIDESVKTFDQSLVEMGGSDNSFFGPLVDDAVDFLANLAAAPFDINTLVDIGLEVLIVEAQEVTQSTFRGESGTDVIILNGLEGEDSTAFNRSLVNGNADYDLIAWARNLDQSTISGGAGDDVMLGISGITESSVINGNKGSDTIVSLGLELRQSSVFGGQGDDSISIGAAESINSLISGDKGDDKINFLAVQSVNTTLSGGEGNDEIDDYSGALRTIGNYLSGGAGNDVLRQAAGIFFSGITQFGSTINGGTGSDIMTGDSTTQSIAPKGYNDEASAGVFDLDGLSSDLFVFAFGDSVLNAAGVGLDTITDFDSNSSFYRYVGGSVAPSSPKDIFAYDANGEYWGLDRLERDQIQLNNEQGLQVNIGIGAGGKLTQGDTNYSVNSNGLVTAGVSDIVQFIDAGAQQDRGDALIWTENDTPSLGAPIGQKIPENPILSYLFISDGVAGLTNGDLLVALDNVGEIDPTGGLQITNGRITDIMTTNSFGPSLPV